MSFTVDWMIIPNERTSVLNQGMQRRGAWADFVRDLGPHVAGDKLGRAVVPYAADWSDGATQPRTAAHKRPGARWTIVSLDLDECSEDQFNDALETLDKGRYAYLAHSTYSYDPEGISKARLHVPLAQPVTEETIQSVKLRLASWLGLETDQSTRGGYSLFFTPRCPQERLADAFIIERHGGPLYWEILPEGPEVPHKGSRKARKAQVRRNTSVTPRARSQWPQEVCDAAEAHLQDLAYWLSNDRGAHLRERLKGNVTLLAGYAASGVIDPQHILDVLKAAIGARALLGYDDHTGSYRVRQLTEMFDWGEARPILPEGFNEDGTVGAELGEDSHDPTKRLLARLKRQTPEKLFSTSEAASELHSFLRMPRRLERWLGLVEVSVGVGKAQPHSEPVLLEQGWTPMGEVVVGDRIYGSDGKLHDVLAVHPQGEREVWEVEFSDGAKVRCDADHLWTFRDKHGAGAKDGGWRTKTSREWAETPLRAKVSGNRLFAPMGAAIERPEADLPLDPYCVGLLTGDGGLTGGGVTFTTADEQLADALRSQGMRLRDYHAKSTGKAKTYGVSVPLVRGRSPLIASLAALGLAGCHGDDKKVPAAILAASASQRLAFLQGLMDTDGCWSKSLVEYVSTSEALVLGVRELVESLGGRASFRQKRTTWTHKGVKKSGVAWRLNFKLPSGMCPFRLDRKVSLWASAAHQSGPTRGVTAIRRLGYLEASSCISVSAPDQLYVTKHHVLTHNTHQTRQFAIERAQRGEYTIILSLDHGLLGQIRRDLVQAGASVRHLASLQQDESRTGNPACLIKDRPDVQAIVKAGASLAGSLCYKCPHKSICPAVKSNRRSLDDKIILAPYQMAARALDMIEQRGDSPSAPLIICDEEPPPPVQFEVDREELQAAMSDEQMWSMLRSDQARAVQVAIEAMLAGDVSGVAHEVVEELQGYHGQLHLTDASLFELQNHAKTLETVKAVLGMSGGWASLLKVYDTWTGQLPSPAWAVLYDRGGFVLSATPNPTYYEPDVAPSPQKLVLRVEDHPTAKAKRVCLVTHHAARRFVLSDGQPAWDLVQADLEELFRLVPADKRILIGTYKAISDSLKGPEAHRLQGRDVALTHYEVVRGRDDWRDRDVFVSMYDPRPPSDSFQEMTDAAARSLEQFHGRARDPQPRELGAVHFHLGTIPPTTWWHDGTGTVGDGRAVVVDRRPGQPPAPLGDDNVRLVLDACGW